MKYLTMLTGRKMRELMRIQINSILIIFGLSNVNAAGSGTFDYVETVFH